MRRELCRSAVPTATDANSNLVNPIYIASLFGKKKNHFSEKEPWYLYAIIIAFAPLVILLIPYLLISSYITEKKREKAVKEQEQREAEENTYKQRASQELTPLKRLFLNIVSHAL